MEKKNIIKNIGFIMDGNRRYAMKKSISLSQGYTEGIEVFFNIIIYCMKAQIENIVFYALSIDNLLKRNKNELKIISNIAFMELQKKKDFFIKNNIQLKFVGIICKLDLAVQKTIKDLELATNNKNCNKKCSVFILFAYDPIKDLSLLHNNTKNKNGMVSSVEIKDIDLIIRTGGNNRLSGFLPLQSIYADLIVLNIFWPEISNEIINNIFLQYNNNNKNYGK